MRRRIDLPSGPREAARRAASGLRGYWSFVTRCLDWAAPPMSFRRWLAETLLGALLSQALFDLP